MSNRMMAMFVAVTVAVGVLDPAFGQVLRAQTREGITVHGHWVIDVRQPDGTLASHHEFENGLLTPGGFVLATLLGHQRTMGKWLVSLPNSPCHPPAQTSFPCYLSEPPALASLFGTVGTLQVSIDQLYFNLILRGSFTAARTGTIARVETMTRSCDASVASADCDGAALFSFSGTNLPSPVQVVSGQIVQITVTLSFS